MKFHAVFEAPSPDSSQSRCSVPSIVRFGSRLDGQNPDGVSSFSAQSSTSGDRYCRVSSTKNVARSPYWRVR